MIAEQPYIGPPLLIFSEYATSPYVFYLSGSSYTKLANPGALPATSTNVAIRSPNGRYVVVVSGAGTGAVRIYDLGSGAPIYIGGLVSPPIWGGINCVKFSPDSTKLLICDFSLSPYIWVYNVSNWTATTAPTPGKRALGCWSPDSTQIALIFYVSPWIVIYNASTGATASGQPASLPSAEVDMVGWSPDGAHLAVATNMTTDKLWVYRTDTWARISSPGTLPSGTPTGNNGGVVWSQDSSRLVVLTNSSPYIWSYTLSGQTLTYETSPVALPSGGANEIVFSPNGAKAFVAAAGATYLMTYVIPGWTRGTDAVTQPTAAATNLNCSIN